MRCTFTLTVYPQEYVRARILQFAPALEKILNPNLPHHVVNQAAQDALQSLPPPDYSGATPGTRELQLVFRHDCQSLGCLDPQCVLCEHNPHRRCSVNFAPKYLVNDVLRAKCDAPIRVEVVDRATGIPIGNDMPELTLEMFVLDGHQYEQRLNDSVDDHAEDIDQCALLLNNKASPLLVPGTGAASAPDGKVNLQLIQGIATLPDLHISDSSEALLSGRKPPFRLIVRVAQASRQEIKVRQAVSEGFVVATRRTRTAGKVEIPNVDDHVSKLEHMGKETVKKLQDIRGSALACSMDVHVPDNCIQKVGEFRKLALLAEADGHLRQKLQQILKLSKEKWDEARDHAMRAVVADNRMRIWYADRESMEVGLLFTCRLGTVDLERPVGLLHKKAQDGAQTTMEATLMAQQTPAQRDQVRMLQPQAAASWWQQGHPGWAIYPVDSEQFMSNGALETLPMPHADPTPLPPSPRLNPTLNPASLASLMGGNNEALLRSLTPFMAQNAQLNGQLGPFGVFQNQPPVSAFANAASALPQVSPRGNNGKDVNAGLSATTQGLTTPFSGGLALPTTAGAPSLGLTGFKSLEGMPSFNLAGLQGMFGGDFSKFPALAGQMNLANFPSVPAMMSGDLEQLIAQHNADSLMPGRLPSLQLDAVNEDRGGSKKPTADTPKSVTELGLGAKPAEEGLQSMQSIELALDGVDKEGLPAVAGEAADEENNLHKKKRKA